MKFIKEETAKRNSVQTIKTEEWALYPMYLGKSIARVRVSRVESYNESGWLVAAILEGTREDMEQLNLTVKLVGIWG